MRGPSLGGEFECVINLSELQIDPALAAMSDSLPTSPSDVVIETFWCNTLGDAAGLEIFEVEMSETSSTAP